MKITSEQLRRIIKEEIEHVLDEAAGQKMKEKSAFSFTIYPSSYEEVINPDKIQGIEGNKDPSFHQDYYKVKAVGPYTAKFQSSLVGLEGEKTFTDKDNSEIYYTIYNAYKAMVKKDFNYKDARYQKLTDLFYDGVFGDALKGVSLLPSQFNFTIAIGLDRGYFDKKDYEAVAKKNPFLYSDIPFKPAENQNQTTGDTNE